MNQAKNQAIINKIQLHYTNIPLAVFLIGANGSGKSTLRNYLNLTDIQMNIDPDVLNRIFRVHYPDTYLIESAKQALTMYQQGIKHGLNLCIESTLSGRGTMERIKHAQACGYFVIGYLVGLNHVDLNIARVKQRVASGGHDISEKAIRRRYVESINNFLQVNTAFNELHIIDNSHNTYRLQVSKYATNLVQHNPTLEDWALKLRKQLLK